MKILVGGSDKGQVSLLAKMANRHGLISGATGTGKTITLQVLAEQFSQLGVPVFFSDVKGDLSGIGQPGKPHPKIDERIEKIGITGHEFKNSPVRFWDLYGDGGAPVRTTIERFGSLLLSRIFKLNDTQSGVLDIVFRISKEKKWPLVDLKDLRSLLNWVGENSKDLQTKYGNVSKASIGAILRDLLQLEDSGAGTFFGEPSLEISDLIQCDQGQGVVNILNASKLVNDKRLYSSFLVWLIKELFEKLPEVGDQDKPKLVFFFDEAHLLFDDADETLLDQIELTVRLIRSKGVGVYFITQSPLDVPESVLGQLGHRVQHALRAFTAKDRKAVKTTAENFRSDGSFDVEEAITSLGVGESLVSVLDDKAAPTLVSRVLNAPPSSQIGPMSEAQVKAVNQSDPLYSKYSQQIDRITASEKLAQQKSTAEEASEAKESKAEAPAKSKRKSNRQSVGEAFAKSISRSIGRQLVSFLMKFIKGLLR